METVGGATLPALAKDISEWFPDLGGRVLPVSETEITPETMPTLPIAMLALLREAPGPNNTARVPHVFEEFVVEFWYKPERYHRDDGTDTPFWAFYDYDSLRNKFLAHLKAWRSPMCGQVRYLGLEVDSSQFAVILSFRFMHEFYLKEEIESVPPDGQSFTIISSICAPVSLYCKEDAPSEEESKCP